MGKGWLDNYNDSKVSAPEGMVGEGYSTKGRNYSPAWGGQFQMGGKLKSSIPVIEDAGNYNEEGRWVPDWKTMTAQAKKLGAKKVKTKHGSLIVFNDNWEVVGVDDNPDAMQMGGYVYPVNYVPKAQDGNIIPSDLPDPVNGIIYDPEGERTYYDDRLDRIVLTPSSDFAPRQSVINHEKFHKYQFDNLLSNYDIAHREALPLFKKPSMVSTDEEYYKFHDRKGREAQQDIKNVKSNYPEFTFVPNKVLFDKIIDREQYSNPFTLEGEAEAYENSLNKFQMGGSIPGAVGFTYARTQSPAPSNGPYAKKTKASAQKGKNIPKLDVSKLDLKNLPKSTGYAWADDIVKKNEKGLEKIKEIKTKVDNKKIADIKKQYNVDDATAKKLYDNSKNLKQEQAEIRPYTPQSTLSKTWEVLTNPMTAFGYAARNEDLPDNFSRGERNNLDMATDIINPAAWANYGARGLSDYSNVPGQLMEGDFTGAGESTLSGTLNLLGAIPLGQELKAITPAAIKTLPKAKNIKDALGTFRGIPTERSLPRLTPEELKAYRQVQEIGRMRATNKPISEQYRYAINQNLPEEHLQRVFGRGRKEIENILPNEAEAQALRDANPIPISERFNLERAPRAPRPLRTNDLTSISSEDIARAVQRNRLREMMGRWDDDINRIGGGVDPEAQNAVLSYSDDYRDFMEGDTSGEYLTPVSKAENFTNRVGDALEQFGGAANRITESQVAKFQNKLGQVISDYPYYEGPVLENVPSLSLSSSGSLKNVSNKVGTQSFSGVRPGDVFTGSLNTSHSSYLPQLKQVFRYNEGTPQFFGYKPMNSLGFLSNFNYSADDIAKYLNTEIDDQIRRGIVPDNILRPYATNKYQNVQLPHYGIKQNPLTHREGGVIKDNRGQWAYPGEVTEIDSNQITMQGVPYPVLGISNTGDVQMMYPDEEYEYDGESVTEYPMAKNGLRQEQKGLVNLDQLTNFTNYNKPQPGGWLNKYN